jgi:hypothetical protein
MLVKYNASPIKKGDPQTEIAFFKSQGKKPGLRPDHFLMIIFYLNLITLARLIFLSRKITPSALSYFFLALLVTECNISEGIPNQTTPYFSKHFIFGSRFG